MSFEPLFEGRSSLLQRQNGRDDRANQPTIYQPGDLDELGPIGFDDEGRSPAFSLQ
jgi:hypothetical protein